MPRGLTFHEHILVTDLADGLLNKGGHTSFVLGMKLSCQSNLSKMISASVRLLEVF